MKPEPVALPRGPGGRDRRRSPRGRPAVTLAAVVALLVAACGESGPPTPAATGAPDSPRPTAVPTAPGSAGPVDSSTGSGPPAVVATGFNDHADGALAGALGTWSWDDAGSDAPWIVPRDGGRVAPAAAISVAFDPPLPPARWTARWARVEETGAGLPLEAAEGSGAVALIAPAGGGTWSLQLDARFAQGRGATWYWRVEVMP